MMTVQLNVQRTTRIMERWGQRKVACPQGSENSTTPRRCSSSMERKRGSVHSGGKGRCSFSKLSGEEALILTCVHNQSTPIRMSLPGGPNVF